MQHMHQVIGDLTKKIEDIENTVTKRYMTLSGLEINDYSKQNVIREVEAFIEYEMNVQVRVEDAYPIGQAVPRQLVVMFLTLQDKHIVLQNRASLKGLVNAYDQQYYFNEYYPTATNEKKRRERDIRSINKEQVNGKMEIKIEKKQLQVNGEAYIKQIHEPTPEDILDLSTAKYEQILSLPLSEEVKLQEKDSSFYAFTASVSSFSAIQASYTQVRLLHPKARHIICAYNIPGDKFYENCDGCDDQEFGATRSILKEMREKNIGCRAFYVVRYCGKEKLNARRFECYLEAAKLALAKSPSNTILGIQQSFEAQETKDASSSHYPTLSKEQEQVLSAVKKVQKNLPGNMRYANNNPRGGGRARNYGYRRQRGRGTRGHYSSQSSKRQEKRKFSNEEESTSKKTTQMENRSRESDLSEKYKETWSTNTGDGAWSTE